jgi:hypothetical protein
MLKDACRRKFDVVMAWAIDRLGRSLVDLLGTIQGLEVCGVDLYLDQQNIDTTTPVGKLLFQITGWTTISGIAAASGLKRAHAIESGQSSGIELGIDRFGQFGLAGTLMRKSEQPDHRATRVPLVAGSQQRLECARVGLPREQMITIDKIEQCHRLPAQRMDHMPVIDDITAFVGCLWSPAAPQCEKP